MKIVQIDPRVDPIWQTLADRGGSSVFHSPSWIQVLTDTYGWQASAYVVLDDRGEPQAGIPFCRIADMMGERILVLPFSDYCDPLVNDQQCWDFLVECLLPNRCPINLRCLHNRIPLTDQRFAVVKQAKWHRLDMRPGLDELWDGMDHSAHRAIRKSQRECVEVRVAKSEGELRAFFEMHLKIRKYKLGMLAQPFVFFQNIWRRFVDKQNGFLLLAVYQDKILAGDFFLQWKDTLYYKFNASLPSDLSHRPNDLLVWEGIRRGKATGFDFLDFGLSDIDQEGLVRYKRKFGTEEKIISFLRCAPDVSPNLAERFTRDLLTQLTRRFTDQMVPDLVTEKAGEDLYRLFT